MIQILRWFLKPKLHSKWYNISKLTISCDFQFFNSLPSFYVFYNFLLKVVTWCFSNLYFLFHFEFQNNSIYYVKCIKTRLETIQKKRRYVHKFTKDDIAELLRRGRDYDAYKRVIFSFTP